MSDLITELRTFLLNETVAGDRIHELVLPATPVLPDLVLQQITNRRTHDIDTYHPQVQISAWAKTPIAARALAKEVDDFMIRYKGYLGPFKVKQITAGDLGNPGTLEDKPSGLLHVPQTYKINIIRS